MELDLVWERPAWEEALADLRAGDVIPAEEFLALLGQASDQEAEEAALALEVRGVSLDVSHLPAAWGPATAADRLAWEAELVQAGAIPGGLEGSDPLALYWRELAALSPCTDAQARVLGRQARAGDAQAQRALAQGLLFLVAEEARAFAGRGVLLLDLMQEAALSLWQAVLDLDEESGLDWARRRVRQAMARTVTLQWKASGDGGRLLQALRAYQQADRQLLKELGRNPTRQELAAALQITVSEVESLAKLLREAAASQRRVSREEPAEDKPVEETAAFQLHSQVTALLDRLEPMDRQVITLRFGLEGKRPCTPEEAARRLGCSVAEVLKRETEALALLRTQQSD